jgi:hypothetical protein
MNSKKYIIIFLLLIIIILLLNYRFEPFMEAGVCNNECSNLGSIEGNCTCINCCKQKNCSKFTNTILQFLDTGDSLDCKILDAI